MEKIDNILGIKVGTGVFVKKDADGREYLDFKSFDRIGRQIVQLVRIGIKPVLITSAGITAGMIRTETATRPNKKSAMPELQRLASVGWGHLLHMWDIYTADLTTGGLLLTRRELAVRSREREEALKTIYAMLSHGDLPIINENDAVTHEEIAFGDNDKLAATLIREMKRSELFGNVLGLVMLSTVDGLYEDKNDSSTLIRVVQNIDAVRHLAYGSDYQNAAGGMVTKLDAFDILAPEGLDMWIANGREDDAIQKAMSGQIGTLFVPNR